MSDYDDGMNEALDRVFNVYANALRDHSYARLRHWYDRVDEAQRIDNTGGDSAVAVVLCSWLEELERTP